MKVLLIGHGAREHAIAEAIMRSKYQPKLFAFMKSVKPGGIAGNPGIEAMADSVMFGHYDDPDEIMHCGLKVDADIAIIGPEEPSAYGVADMLENAGIPTVGPRKEMAKLETD